ncbi:hypothetical protein M501DRAFT_1017392 [Patellaria atrata CBS 101060]|uniref:Heterokaryon incompatibility domain-containing protein n=1 Tax=Patellaria atrata CBS 101060 TaxID=1346257 RepID=A0A9P4VQJ0_9PEZI|nr:hypothetical protein M501DRAFT_1017392 [Patellaria atrata CBS 101060]
MGSSGVSSTAPASAGLTSKQNSLSVNSIRCPHQLQRLSRVNDDPTFQYLCHLDQPRVSHAACASNPRCVANHVDFCNYETRHISDGCRCSHISVSREEIIRIIQSGGTPLVSLRRSASSGELECHIEKQTVRSRYVAISHVWADGLGNPQANSLPKCQLVLLQKHLQNLPVARSDTAMIIGGLCFDLERWSASYQREDSCPLFWMDTLCIPVGDEKTDVTEVKMKAINRMASIYAGAFQVLVLDSSLLRCRSQSTSATEILGRIICSSWQSRSWTLQEGVLGRECVFQFADAAVNPIYCWDVKGPRSGISSAVQFPSQDDAEQQRIYAILYDFLWDELHQEWKSSLEKSGPEFGIGLPSVVRKNTFFKREKIEKICAMHHTAARPQNARHFAHMSDDESRVNQLVAAWNQLAVRSTTMVDDIHIIIANLLNFNAAHILRLGTQEERMKAIIFSSKALPFSLLYNTGARALSSEQKKNRWVPLQPSKSPLTSKPIMKACRQGYHVQFDEDDENYPQVIIVRDVAATSGPHSQVVQLSSGERYQITAVDHIDVPKQTLSHPLCIFIEPHSSPDSKNTQRRGVSFRVMGYSKPKFPPANSPSSAERKPTTLNLLYLYPLIVEQLPTQSNPTFSTQFTTNTPTILPHHLFKYLVGTSLPVLNPKDPSSSPFPYPRRPLSLSPIHHAGIISWFSIIILLPGFVSLLVSIALISEHGRITPTANSLLITFGTLYLVAILSVTSLMLVGTALGWRAWMRSFEDEWRGSIWEQWEKVDRGLSEYEPSWWPWKQKEKMNDDGGEVGKRRVRSSEDDVTELEILEGLQELEEKV